METNEEKLRKYLNLLWLRPENALLTVFKSLACAHIEFKSPSLDISCGDGINMFLHLGGELHEDFDYFRTTRAKEFKHNAFVDIYDKYDDNYTVDIVQKPAIKIDVGTDWKQALLDKAAKLDLYKKLLLHDNNKIPFPFPDNKFMTIYSNSIYWTENIENLLSEIHRMLKPGGTAVLEVMTPSFTKTLDELEPYFSKEAIDIIDRQRRSTMKGARYYKEWKETMLKAGFTIEETKCVYPSKILIDIWNIGLRPISHLLIQMSDNLLDKERHEIKKQWVNIFLALFKPLITIEQTYSLEKAPYLCFKLSKRA